MANFVLLKRHTHSDDLHGSEVLVNLDNIISIRSVTYKNGKTNCILETISGLPIDVKENFDDLKALLEVVGVNFGRVSFLKKNGNK